MSDLQDSRARARHFRISGPILGIGLLAISAALWLGLRGVDLWATDSPAKAETTTLELAAADVATVARAVLTRSLPVTGSLSPLVQTTVKAQAPGEVLEVTVREGQTVRDGDVLVRIDTRTLDAELDSRQAALEKARADLALAKLNRDNSASLLEKRVISQNAYDTTESAWQANLASVKLAEAQLSQARIALGYATVRATFDGTIAQRLVQPGEKVESGSSLLTLVDLSHLELQAPAPADEISSVKVGQIATFHVGGFGERRFEGRVERINPMTDTSSRSVMLYLSVENPDGALKGGMFAQGELILDETEPVAAIPLTAVRTEAGLPYVFAIDGGKIARRPVTLGLRSEEQNLVELRAGLETGARVVSAKINTLKDGTPVTVTAPTAGSTAYSSH
ncbi:MAG: efflux RND transporter periplasmic adaptor subunit [Gammaproteobacteria bacterium]|nr:efflux RND transporter periplasmic adaptor subunit [Gammaproteobacteria bacterium]